MSKFYQFLVIFLSITSCTQKTEQPCDNDFIRGNNYILSSDF